MTITMTARRAALTLACALAPLAPAAVAQENEPFRLSEALDLPEELRVWGAVRARYQRLDGQFRPGLPELDQVLALRTLLGVEARVGSRLRIGAEFQDSRLLLDDESTPVGVGTVNAAELLQVYAALDLSGGIMDGDRASLTVGRVTHDQGRRRFLARNGFRNTINAFTGALFEWSAPGGEHALEAFWFLPVQRLPGDRPSLLRDDVQFDNESFAQQFWGVHYTKANLPLDLTGSLFLYGLHERDGENRNTRNRQLFTPGFALHHLSRPGEYFLDVEAAVNIGTSRATGSPLDTEDLDHLAYFLHAEAGWHFEAPWSPRLLLQYDVASGDADPEDDRFGRFDTLFGSRRADFGHTDIFGALARGNIHAFALGTQFRPNRRTRFRVRYQAAFLEEARDVWLTVGVVDPTGQSGVFIGHHIETRGFWDVVPGNVRLGAGSGFLINGRFADTAPNANGFGNAIYFYTDVTVRF